MKPNAKKTISIIALAGIAWAGATHVAHASLLSVAFESIIIDPVLKLVGYLAYIAMTIAGWFLTVCGTLLNASISLTLHIKDILTVMPAVYSTWAIIRDISSIFFIFMLLYAAAAIILQVEDRLQIHLSSLIKNLIIAGVLINFSFFFVSVMIDASNIVSLQFYNAIAPGKDFNPATPGSNLVSSAFNDGGISNVFMQALAPQASYANNGALKGGDVNINAIIAGVGGTVIMTTAGLSFLAAAFAFVIRTGMLLLLLAFSPLWMAGMVIPKIKAEMSDKWWGYLYSNLVFMPVYLLFTYVAMRMLLGDDPAGLNGPSTAIANSLFHMNTFNASGGVGGAPYLGMIMSYVLALLFINFPLLAAMRVGGVATDIGKKYSGTFQGWAQKRLGTAGRGAWMYTGGRAASAVSRSERLKNFAGNSQVGEYALKGIRGVAGSYDKKLKSQVESRTDFAESLGYNQGTVGRWESRLRSIRQQMGALPSDPRRDTAEQAATRRDLKRDADDTERIIREQKGARKESFMRRTDKPQIDTLWTKVARKDKKAAAKIQADIYEARLKEQKDDLKDIKNDIKNLENAIRNNPSVGNAAAGTANEEQRAELTRLTGKRDRMQVEINQIETNLGLEKSDASA